MSAGPGGAPHVHNAPRAHNALRVRAAPRVRAALPGAPLRRGCLVRWLLLLGQLSREQLNLVLLTVSAARAEKLANRCPLCHENFSQGEEMRASRGHGQPRMGNGDKLSGAGLRAGDGEHSGSILVCSSAGCPNRHSAYLCAQVISSVHNAVDPGGERPSIWGDECKGLWPVWSPHSSGC